jgi:hypothetical protein
MSLTPASPDETLDEETKGILAERNAIFDQEDMAAKPWSEVKVEILTQRKRNIPR